MFALGAPMLIGMVGLAIDTGRIYVAQARLQAAVDAAAFAGSYALFQNPDPLSNTVQSQVADYLTRNYPEATLGGGAGGAITPPPDPDVNGVCVTAQVDVPMTFMSVLGVGAQTISATSCTGFNDVEVVMVLDNTGSMRGVPISEVRLAAKKMVDVMLRGAGSQTVQLGLVPFRGKVQTNSGCVNADGTLNTEGPVENCYDAIPKIKALDNRKNKLKNRINQLNAPGGWAASSGTLIGEGIKWGREVLSSEWPYTQGAPEGTVRKVMILLTDGDNEDGTCGAPFGCPWNSPGCDSRDPRTSSRSTYRRNAYYGMGFTDCHCNDYGCLDQAMLQEADTAKTNYGIEVFAIRYGNSDFVDRELMRTVASEPKDEHYLDAPDAAAIQEQFEAIGRQLVRLL